MTTESFRVFAISIFTISLGGARFDPRECSFRRFLSGEYMAKRLLIVLLLMAALVGGLGFVKYRQVESAIAAGASFQIPPTSVTTVVAKRETWPSTLSVIGTAAAIQGVTVIAELP